MSFRNNKHARYISANIEVINGVKSLNITQDEKKVDLIALVQTLMDRISVLENPDAATATVDSTIVRRISALENADASAITNKERTLMGRISALESASASASTAQAATTTREKLQGYMEKKLEKRLETLEKKTVTLAELADVDVSDLSDGATLGYDAATQRWTPFVEEVSADHTVDDDLELITTD